MQNFTTIIKVWDVQLEKLNPNYGHSTLEKIFFKKSDGHKNLKVEASSENDILQNEIRLSNPANGLFSACSFAYSKHLNLSLSPDDFKLAILQGFASHINQNSEIYRERFVNYEGKKTIRIRRDDFIRGSPNPWTEVFAEFSDKINIEIKDKKLVEFVQSSLSTSTPTSLAAFNITLMDSMKTYFDFRMRTMCGIPSIELKGNLEDWNSLLELLDYVATYDLEWWTREVKMIINNIIRSISGELDENEKIKFWKDIVNINGGSGGPYYNGWICKLFPYLGTHKIHKNSFNYETNYGGGIDIDLIPSGLSSVPIKWDYYGTEYDYVFTSGFYGFLYNNQTHTIRPEISWLVYENPK